MERQKEQADNLANEWYKRAQLALTKVRFLVNIKSFHNSRRGPPCPVPYPSIHPPTHTT